MTSEMNTIKTSELLRRRKLRLQQVREQSKDIAKRLRERASAETIQSFTDLDAKKEREFIAKQEKIVHQLEELYSRQKQNVGVGHRNASGLVNQEFVCDGKLDKSRQRAKVAAYILREQKQQQIDKQKKLLDRKLLAREIANEISRDKTKIFPSKLPDKNTKGKEIEHQDTINEIEVDENKSCNVELHQPTITKIDMGTQWDNNNPNIPDREPSIPPLPLRENNQDTPQSYNSKRMDLFAVSEEMPSSLRRDPITVREYLPRRPSLTLVSEFLRNRNMRLRETEPVKITANNVKTPEDFQCIKKTIIRSRASRDEGMRTLCQVHDEEVVPVPSWRVGPMCCCVEKNARELLRNPFLTNHLNKRTLGSMKIPHSVSLSPKVKGSSQFLRKKVDSTKPTKDCVIVAKPESSNRTTESSLSRKNPITVYNHASKDATKVKRHDDVYVIRNDHQDEDAFTKAIKKSSTEEIAQRDKGTQDSRNRIAVNKQNVDKEYKDTMAFLKTLSKKNNINIRPNKTAFMDEQRQRSMNENRQHKMRCDFRKIQREQQNSCYKTTGNNYRNRSPNFDDFEEKSFQYSWRPVPDYDVSTAANNVPTNIREKSNNVRFNIDDNYHEFRSRHKHSPPTRDNQAPINTRPIEPDADEYSTATSDFEGESENKTKGKQMDADRVVVYKIYDTKGKKKKSKFTNDAVPLKEIEIENIVGSKICESYSDESSEDGNPTPFQVKEGIYKAVSEKGDNIIPKQMMHTPTNKSQRNEHNSPKRKIVKHHCTKQNKKTIITPSLADIISEESTGEVACLFTRKHKTTDTNTDANAQGTQTIPEQTENKCHPSAATSATSFKSVVYNDSKMTEAIDANFVKVLDDNGKEAGKFYIGASGFLNDQSYEVVIQLRKKQSGIQEGTKTQAETAKSSKEDETNVVQAELEKELKGKINREDKLNNFAETEPVRNSNENKIDQAQVQKVPLQENTDNDVNIISPPKSNKDPNQPNAPVYITNIHVSEPTPHVSTTFTAQTKTQKPNTYPNHMSSSASTTYMSPPDNIRPKFLRNNASNQDTDADVSEINDCEKKCDYNDGKLFIRTSSSNSIQKSIKSHHEKHKCPETPPNTRTQSKCSIKHKHSNCSSKRSIKHRPKYVSPYRTRGKIHTCRKSSSSEPSKKSSKSTLMLNNYFPKTNMTVSKQKSIKQGKSNLNPVVKNYVNKVLNLNKEGLKAMEIINQDCSSVTTPGSSVINAPNNLKKRGPTVDTKISLGQITEILKQQIINDLVKEQEMVMKAKCDSLSMESNISKSKHIKPLLRKKSVHKIKSLYIPKHFKKKKTHKGQNLTSDSNGNRDINLNLNNINDTSNKIASTDNSNRTSDTVKNTNNSHSTDSTKSHISKTSKKSILHISEANKPVCNQRRCYNSEPTSDSLDNNNNKNKKTPYDPTSSSTQTIDNDMNILKLASDKLENMQKIADLTEKCTKRLTNLAKILDEVRKNKSAAYNQLITTETSSDTEGNSTEQLSLPARKINSFENVITAAVSEEIKPDFNSSDNCKQTAAKSLDFDLLLKGIPKPVSDARILPTNTEATSHLITKSVNIDSIHKVKSKPPPALATINLKHSDDRIIPHELSTVIEVDSPMSLKNKNSSTIRRNKTSTPEPSSSILINLNEETQSGKREIISQRPEVNQNNVNKSNNKLEMMDLNKFNEIMLKPYISLEEYAKQYNLGLSDEGTNLEDLKTYFAADDLTSLHSESSLPDVIAELLKRNIISEPFKFDSASNVNSTTASSESSVSVFALSKATREGRKDKTLDNKETSDSISVSSNPDLEKAFKKLGLGWASSTLKKTKERLALSSSSSSSSCTSQRDIFKQCDITPVHSKRKDVTTIGSPVTHKTSSPKRKQNKSEAILNNVEQQTSTSKLMTVKEFLENELAKRITFTSSAHKDDTDQFVSLYETRMPEAIRNPPRDINDSLFNLNRVRTSTPVQMFKSSTYNSSSSTNNNSNGLFNNMDELSSVKGTSSSAPHHTTSDKDDLTIPNLSLKSKKEQSDHKNDS